MPFNDKERLIWDIQEMTDDGIESREEIDLVFKKIQELDENVELVSEFTQQEKDLLIDIFTSFVAKILTIVPAPNIPIGKNDFLSDEYTLYLDEKSVRDLHVYFFQKMYHVLDLRNDLSVYWYNNTTTFSSTDAIDITVFNHQKTLSVLKELPKIWKSKVSINEKQRILMDISLSKIWWYNFLKSLSPNDIITIFPDESSRIVFYSNIIDHLPPFGHDYNFFTHIKPYPTLIEKLILSGHDLSLDTWFPEIEKSDEFTKEEKWKLLEVLIARDKTDVLFNTDNLLKIASYSTFSLKHVIIKLTKNRWRAFVNQFIELKNRWFFGAFSTDDRLKINSLIVEDLWNNNEDLFAKYLSYIGKELTHCTKRWLRKMYLSIARYDYWYLLLRDQWVKGLRLSQEQKNDLVMKAMPSYFQFIWVDVSLYDIDNVDDFLRSYLSLVMNNQPNEWRSKAVFLWARETSLKKYFKTTESYQKFMDDILRNKSWNITKNMNDRFDIYFHEQWGVELNEVREDLIYDLSSFKLEEIISMFGNYQSNRNTTFEAMFFVLDEYFTWDFTRCFWYIKTLWLDPKTESFLKWQLIVWLLAKWENQVVDQFASSSEYKDEFYNLIDGIVRYRRTVFTRDSYLWLLMGLQNTIRANNDVAREIYERYSKKPEHSVFYQSILLTMYVADGSWKPKTLWPTWVVDLREENKVFEKYLNKYSFPLDKLRRKKHDVCTVYGWDSEWGWNERYALDIMDAVNRLWYTKLDVWYWDIVWEKWGAWSFEPLTVLEKNWVRMFFVRYDDMYQISNWTNYVDKINNQLLLAWNTQLFYPLLTIFRWHNYYTKQMILDLFDEKKIKNSNLVWVDWWCSSQNALASYRSSWIDNPMITYNHTWKWDPTYAFMTWFITHFIRPNLSEENYTWSIPYTSIMDMSLPEWWSKNVAYAKKHMVPPWSLIDVVLDFEKNSNLR